MPYADVVFLNVPHIWKASWRQKGSSGCSAATLCQPAYFSCLPPFFPGSLVTWLAMPLFTFWFRVVKPAGWLLASHVTSHLARIEQHVKQNIFHWPSEQQSQWDQSPSLAGCYIMQADSLSFIHSQTRCCCLMARIYSNIIINVSMVYEQEISTLCKDNYTMM